MSSKKYKDVLTLTILFAVFCLFTVSIYASYTYYHSYKVTVEPFIYNFQPLNITVTPNTTGERKIAEAFYFRTHDMPLAVTIKLENTTQLKQVFQSLNITLNLVEKGKVFRSCSLSLDKPITDTFIPEREKTYPILLVLKYKTLPKPNATQTFISFMFEAVEGGR